MKATSRRYHGRVGSLPSFISLILFRRLRAYFFIATWLAVAAAVAGCGCVFEFWLPKLALTVKTTTSGLTAFESDGAAGAFAATGAESFTASLCVSIFRLLNSPPENSKLWPNFVTEYSFGDSPLIVTSPSFCSMLVRYRPGT